MTINSELFKAIPALDSYDHGYGTGIDLTGTQIGNATIEKNSSNSLGIGNDSAIGFYASSFILPSGEIAISYRGANADSILKFLTDSWWGYGVGVGSPGGS